MLLMSEREDKQTGKTYKANGRALKSYREREKLTLKQLEERAVVSYTQISRIENGTSKSPRWDTLERLAEALGRDVDDLVIYEEISDMFSEKNVEALSEKRREHGKRHDQERERQQEGEGSGDNNEAGDRIL